MTRKEQIIAEAEAQNYPNPEFSEDWSYGAFIEGAQWADRTMIEKACEFLKEALDGAIIRDFHTGNSISTSELIEKFRKAIEE